MSVQYLVGFDTQQDALMRSAELLDMKRNGNYTKYMFAFCKHATEDNYALIIPESDISKLTQEEQNSLKSRQQLINDGWIANE